MRLTLLLLFCLTLSAQSPGIERERALGAQVAAGVRRSTTPVESTEVQNYVARVGAKLAAQLPNAGGRYTFSVVSNEQSNALHEPLVLPGGWIFVPSSLLLAADSEPEFAGMLGQAMARGPLQIRTVPVAWIEGFDATLLPGAGLNLRRTAELRADTVAIEALARAGFDPAGLLHYIERMQPSDYPRSPFPARTERIAALREDILSFSPAAYTESGDFVRIKEILSPKRSSVPSLR